MTNPYASPNSHSPESECGSSGVETSITLIALHLLSPLIWFGISVVLINSYAHLFGAIGQPFINMDKWTQGRVVLVALAGFGYLILAIGVGRPPGNRRLSSAILGWNCAVILAAFGLAYYQWPHFTLSLIHISEPTRPY